MKIALVKLYQNGWTIVKETSHGHYVIMAHRNIRIGYDVVHSKIVNSYRV